VYGGARLRLWQVVVLGGLWIVAGLALHLAVDWDAPRHVRSIRGEGIWVIIRALKLWISAPVGIGLYHWWRAAEVVRAERSEAAATTEPVAPRPSARKPQTEPLQPPPRLGDDPFREPPRAAPIIVQRHESRPAAVPIVAGDPGDKPKLLS
jgi:hypothetical protein